MKGVQIAVFIEPTIIHSNEKIEHIPENSLVVADINAQLGTSNSDKAFNLFFYTGEFYSVYKEVNSLMLSEQKQYVNLKTHYTIPTGPKFIEAVKILSNRFKNRHALLRFICVYCLSVEQSFFSNLIRQMISDNDSFFEFMEKSYLNNWSVNRYAEELGLPVRKLNFLFYEKYGISPKQWLLERRLRAAYEMLVSTEMQVSEIALECGFSNHAHFSDSFKKRYNHRPKDLRTNPMIH